MTKQTTNDQSKDKCIWRRYFKRFKNDNIIKVIPSGVTFLGFSEKLQYLKWSFIWSWYICEGREETARLPVYFYRNDTHMTSIKIAHFSRPLAPLAHLRPKFFHPLDFRRPISNEPLPRLSKWYCACERTKSKQKQNQVTSYSNWPRVLLFDLVHKQCNGIIKGWLYCLTPESRGSFLVSNISMFDLACSLVMVQIQFSLTKKIKIGRPEHSLPPTHPFVRQHLIFVLTLHPVKVDVMCVSPLIKA